jgi:hypothetical protein
MEDHTGAPGLMEAEFFCLFLQCEVLVLITAHPMLSLHDCNPQVVDDSELAMSDSEGDMAV